MKKAALTLLAASLALPLSVLADSPVPNVTTFLNNSYTDITVHYTTCYGYSNSNPSLLKGAQCFESVSSSAPVKSSGNNEFQLAIPYYSPDNKYDAPFLYVTSVVANGVTVYTNNGGYNNGCDSLQWNPTTLAFQYRDATHMTCQMLSGAH